MTELWRARVQRASLFMAAWRSDRRLCRPDSERLACDTGPRNGRPGRPPLLKDGETPRQEWSGRRFSTPPFPMKIIRHLSPSGPAYAALQPDGSAREISGDIFGDFRVTDRTIKPGKTLAPVSPVYLPCIGLNYKK